MAPYIADVLRTPFIEPSAPVLGREPSRGREWIHEVKHDGWRAQLHKAGDDVVIFSRSGADFTKRFRSIADAVLKLPTPSAIVDAELIACDAEGAPNFYALMGGAKHGCCAYCFDLLEFEGRSLVGDPLDERRFLLRRLMQRADRDTGASPKPLTIRWRCWTPVRSRALKALFRSCEATAIGRGKTQGG